MAFRPISTQAPPFYTPQIMHSQIMHSQIMHSQIMHSQIMHLGWPLIRLRIYRFRCRIRYSSSALITHL
jgi:hypothetical protein